MKKKILALIITLAMVIGSFTMVYAVPPDVIGTSYEEPVERLVNLGVITGYPDGTYGPNDKITRSEFAAIAVRAKELGHEVPNSMGSTIFGDIPPGYWANGFINVAENNDLIKGKGIVNGVNSFGPLLNITYEEAVTIVLRAIGYESEAIIHGGWPDGYLTVASQIGLLQNVNGTKGMLATRGMVARLTYNALEIPNMIKLGSSYIVSGTQGTDPVYLFDNLNPGNKVVSVEGINPTQILVKFTKKLDSADAKSKSPYKVSLGGVTFTGTPVLSEDGKELTLTANSAINVKNVPLVVEPIKIQLNPTLKTEKYTMLFSHGDPEESIVKFTEGETASIDQGTTLALDVKLENTTDANISVAAGDVTGLIIDKFGTTAPVTGLTPAAFVALKGNTVSLGTVGNPSPDIGVYTIIVTVEESPSVKHTGQLTLTVEPTAAQEANAQAVIDEIDALGSSPTKLAVTTADGNYGALDPNNEQPLVTNYDELKEFVDDINDGIAVEALMAGLTTNKLVKDARSDYNALGALGKAEVVSYANLTAAELAFSNAKAAMTNAIGTAQPLYNAQKARLDSFTPSEINLINANSVPANGFTTYNVALAALKVDLDAAKAVNLEADGTTVAAITGPEATLTAQIGTFNTAKGVFDSIPEVISTGK